MNPMRVQESIQKLESGDTSCLPTLMQHYRPRLRKMVELRAGGQLSARVDPSDIVQDAFTEASRKVTRYIQKPSVGFFVWLRGLTRDALFIARRQHVEAQRRSITREVALPTDGSAMFARQLVTNSSPSSRMVRLELHEAVTSAINEMKVSDQEVILMRHFEGMSNNEVAEALGVSASTATMRHGRALARLKPLLEDRLSLSSGGNR